MFYYISHPRKIECHTVKRGLDNLQKLKKLGVSIIVPLFRWPKINPILSLT